MTPTEIQALTGLVASIIALVGAVTALVKLFQKADKPQVAALSRNVDVNTNTARTALTKTTELSAKQEQLEKLVGGNATPGGQERQAPK